MQLSLSLSVCGSNSAVSDESDTVARWIWEKSAGQPGFWQKTRDRLLWRVKKETIYTPTPTGARVGRRRNKRLDIFKSRSPKSWISFATHPQEMYFNEQDRLVFFLLLSSISNLGVGGASSRHKTFDLSVAGVEKSRIVSQCGSFLDLFLKLVRPKGRVFHPI